MAENWPLIAKATAEDVVGNEVVGLTSCLKQHGLVGSMNEPDLLDEPLRLDSFGFERKKSNS